MRRLSSLGVCVVALAVAPGAQTALSPQVSTGVEVGKFMWAEVGLPGGVCHDCPSLTQAAFDYRWRNRKYKYVASAEVVNNGPKIIKSIELDFVFADAGTGHERLRYRVRSNQKIRPGQKKEARKLIKDVKAEGNNYSPANPSQELVSLTGDGVKVVINRIEYADGSFWQRPGQGPRSRA